MSWLKPENIKSSGHASSEEEEDFLGKYGKAGDLVLNSLSKVDPLQYNAGGYNRDAYMRYASRFMEILADTKLDDLSQEDVKQIVESTFNESQIGRGWVEERSAELVARHIKGQFLREE